MLFRVRLFHLLPQSAVWKMGNFTVEAELNSNRIARIILTSKIKKRCCSASSIEMLDLKGS